jgi:dTDP-4-dehydrorhamnose reductase
MPFGRERQDKNLLVKLAHYPKLIDVRNSLTCIEDAVKAIMYFARTLPPPGIYNVTNPGSVTTREIADWMGLKKQWFVDEAEFLKTVKAPRSNCTLDTSKLEALYSMRKVSDALKDCIGHWRQGQEA